MAMERQPTAADRRSGEEVILEVRDASVSFSTDDDSRVLRDVNLSVRAGEALGVVGESGSGKSMLASAMLDAVVSPGQVSGEVIYHPPNGDPVDILSLSREELMALRWNEISFVIQGAQSAFNPTMVIGDHFEETLRAHDADVEAGMEHARELLADLFLPAEQVLRSHPHELSGGMKQRALIALGLVLEPNIVVMDEPTAALDLLMQRSILRLLKDVQRKYEIAMVFITHDLPLVAELADRLAVMYAFEFIEFGPTESILRDAAHPYTRSLLNATPNLATPLENMNPIAGSAPDPVDTPVGCSYHPRCPLSDGLCEEADPGFQRVDDVHHAACFHWDESADEIPFSLREVEGRL